MTRLEKSLSSCLPVVLVIAMTAVATAQTDFWEQSNGPLGATVTEAVFHPVSGELFIAIDGEGVYRSVNGDMRWLPATTGIPATTTIQALAVNASGDLFAGTNNNGIYRSTDNGGNWIQVYAGTLQTRNIQSMAVDLQSGEILAGTSFSNDGTLLRSGDGGATWMEFTSGLQDVGVIQALAINSSTGEILAGSSRTGVLRSTDRGANWNQVSNGLLPYVDVNSVFVHSNGDLFAGADSSITEHRIFRSTDNGTNWVQVHSVNTSVISFGTNSGGDLFAGTEGSGILASTDGGNTWLARNAGLRNFTINAIAVDSNDDLFVGTFCAGIFHSANDGGNWTPVNTDLIFTRVLSLVVHPTTGYLFAGTDCAGMFRSIDNGENWTWLGFANRQVNSFLLDSGGNIFTAISFFTVLGTDGDVYRSTDHGDTWTDVSSINDFVLSLAMAPNGDMYAGTGFFELCGLGFCDYGDIYRSIDGGSSWHGVASKLDDTVLALAVGPNGRVYAATPEGTYRSFGEFWHKVNPYDTKSLVIEPVSGDIFVGTTGGIYRSSNEGENWSFVEELPNNPVWSLFDNPLNDDLLAGTQTSGVLHSSDHGVTWTPLSTGLFKSHVRALAIDASTGRFYSGTYGGGVFRSVEPATRVTENPVAMPASFVLEQNYPNPFNPSTTIAFALPRPVHVELKVYSVLGGEVATLVKGHVEAGVHRVKFEASDLPAGVYFYRLRAGTDFIQTRKLTVVK